MPWSVGAQDLLLDLSYSVLYFILFVHNLSLISCSLTSPHSSLCHTCFSMANISGLWLVQLKLQLWFLVNWTSSNRQITITRYHPTTTTPCSFGTRFDRILANKSELNFAHFETWLVGLISCLFHFLVFCLFFYWWGFLLGFFCGVTKLNES